jgi:hypothetical protein
MFRPELAAPSEGGAVARTSTRALDTLTFAIVEAQAAGLAPAGDPTPLVLTCWSAVHGLASLWLDGPLARIHGASGAPPERLAATVSSTLASLMIGAARSDRNPTSRRRLHAAGAKPKQRRRR